MIMAPKGSPSHSKGQSYWLRHGLCAKSFRDFMGAS